VSERRLAVMLLVYDERISEESGKPLDPGVISWAEGIIDNPGKHGGDCTGTPATCMACASERYREMARLMLGYLEAEDDVGLKIERAPVTRIKVTKPVRRVEPEPYVFDDGLADIFREAFGPEHGFEPLGAKFSLTAAQMAELHEP
jgi:hypothetical protein